MTPFDIFRTFEVFKSVMAGTDVPNELKLQVAKEFKAALSPAAFSSSCKVTRQWLEDTVQAKIDQLQADEDRKTSKAVDSKADPSAGGEAAQVKEKEVKAKGSGSKK